MTIHFTAYNTRACNGFVVGRTVDAIKEADAWGGLPPADAAKGVYLIQGGNAAINAIPAFAHPLLVVREAGDTIIATDIRPFGSYDEHQAVFRSRNEIELRLAVHRAHLNAIWVTQSPTLLRDVSQAPLALYASWISENVTKRFHLDPGTQLTLSILAAVHYTSLFTNETVLSENEKLRVCNAITRALRVSAEDVLKVLDATSVIPSLQAFCEQAALLTQDVRLKDFNVGLLFTILSGSWFGTNAAEMLTVALEHPPTWLAILLAAYSERTYHKSGIAQLTERSGNRSLGQDYQRAVLNLLAHH